MWWRIVSMVDGRIGRGLNAEAHARPSAIAKVLSGDGFLIAESRRGFCSLIGNRNVKYH